MWPIGQAPGFKSSCMASRMVDSTHENGTCSLRHMTCPRCARDDSKVLDSRRCQGEIVRRRACQACGHRFTTAERITAEYMQVRKRDGSVEAFSRAKLSRGIMKAAGGRKVSPADLKTYVDRVVQVLKPDAPNVPVLSSDIGDLVLQYLQKDAHTEVLRVRYAMVLRGRAGASGAIRSTKEFLAWLAEEYGDQQVSVTGSASVVLKRDGKREAFQPEKLARSIGIASKGRGTDEQVRHIAEQIASSVRDSLRGQVLVSTGQIAAESLKALLQWDALAYLRYASVVKRYESVADFWAEASGLPD